MTLGNNWLAEWEKYRRKADPTKPDLGLTQVYKDMPEKPFAAYDQQQKELGVLAKGLEGMGELFDFIDRPITMQYAAIHKGLKKDATEAEKKFLDAYEREVTPLAKASISDAVTKAMQPAGQLDPTKQIETAQEPEGGFELPKEPNAVTAYYKGIFAPSEELKKAFDESTSTKDRIIYGLLNPVWYMIPTAGGAKGFMAARSVNLLRAARVAKYVDVARASELAVAKSVAATLGKYALAPAAIAEKGAFKLISAPFRGANWAFRKAFPPIEERLARRHQEYLAGIISEKPIESPAYRGARPDGKPDGGWVIGEHYVDTPEIARVRASADPNTKLVTEDKLPVTPGVTPTLPEGYLVRGDIGILSQEGIEQSRVVPGIWATDQIGYAKAYGAQFSFMKKPQNPLRVTTSKNPERYVMEDLSKRYPVKGMATDSELWASVVKGLKKEGYDAVEFSGEFTRVAKGSVKVSETWFIEQPKLYSYAEITIPKPLVTPEIVAGDIMTTRIKFEKPLVVQEGVPNPVYDDVVAKATKKLSKKGLEPEEFAEQLSKEIKKELSDVGYDGLVVKRTEGYLEFVPFGKVEATIGLPTESFGQYVPKYRKWEKEYRKYTKLVDQQEMTPEQGIPVGVREVPPSTTGVYPIRDASGNQIGIMNISRQKNYNVLEEINIAPELQRQGKGTEALLDAMRQSPDENLIVSELTSDGQNWLNSMEKKGLIKIHKVSEKTLKELKGVEDIHPDLEIGLTTKGRKATKGEILYRGVGKDQKAIPEYVTPDIEYAQEFGKPSVGWKLERYQLMGNEKVADFTVGSKSYAQRLKELGFSDTEIAKAKTRQGAKELLRSHGFEIEKKLGTKASGENVTEYTLLYPERYKPIPEPTKTIAKTIIGEPVTLEEHLRAAREIPSEEYSVARGYSEEARANFKKLGELEKEGKALGVPEDDVAGISAALRGVVKDARADLKLLRSYYRSYKTGGKELPEIMDILLSSKYEGANSAYNAMLKAKGQYEKAVVSGKNPKAAYERYYQKHIVAQEAVIKAYEKEVGMPLSEEILGDSVDETVKSLVGFIEQLRQINKSYAKEAAEARVVKAARLHGAIGATRAEAAAEAGQAARAGREVFQEFEQLRTKFETEKVAEMFEFIRLTRRIPAREIHSRENTMLALGKLLNGEHLQRNEMKFLENAFGKELGESLYKHRLSTGEYAWKTIVDIIGIPKSLMATADFSFPFRQGALLIYGNPKEGIKAFPDMIKASFSPERFEMLQQSIMDNPWHELAQRAKLELVDILSPTASFVEREEFFASRIAENLPLGLGKMVRFGERGFISYANKMRMDIFSKEVAKMSRDGLDVFGKGFTQVEELAKMINLATGRGNLGQLTGAAQLLNIGFFAPRLIVSRFQFMGMLKSSSPTVRKLAAKNLAAFIGTNVGIIKLFEMSGLGEVEWNPKSSQFAKIRIGNTYIDPWAGYQPIIRSIAQIGSGQRKTATGRLEDTNRLDVLMRFWQGKAAPFVSMVATYLAGKTFTGEEVMTRAGVGEDVLKQIAPDFYANQYQKIKDTGAVGISRTFLESHVPLFFQDVMEGIEQEGSIGAALATPGAFGFGFQAYDTASQIYGEVNYNMTLYQDLHMKARELAEDQNWEKLNELIKENRDAQLFMTNNGLIMSRTYQELGVASREVKKILDTIDKLKRSPKSETQEYKIMIAQLERKAEEISTQAMLMVDSLKEREYK